MALPVFLDKVAAPLGLGTTFQILSVLMLVQAFLALTFKPLLPAGAGMGPPNLGPGPAEGQTQPGSAAQNGSRWSRVLATVRKYFNLRVFHIVTYRVWAFGVATAVLGYFVPYIHLVRTSHTHTWVTSCVVCYFNYVDGLRRDCMWIPNLMQYWQ